MKKFLTSFISFILVLSMASAVSWAAEEAEIPEEGITEVNPIYEDVLSEAELLEAIDEETGKLASSSVVYTSWKDAGAYVRKQMKNRAKSVTIKYSLGSGDYEKMVFGILGEAFRHTGVPDEGDYILWQYGGFNVDKENVQIQGSIITFTMEFDYVSNDGDRITYHSSLEQEKQVTEEVGRVLESLNLSGKSDDQKVKSIYDHITSTVTYGDVGEPISYTAYAAVINHRAVCQGYALLMYRMLLEEGIDCRIIAGYGGGGNHGWNIVRLGDYWYNLDATWDAGALGYRFFLKSDAGFPGHERWNAAVSASPIDYTSAAFYAEHPMGTGDYVCVDEGHRETVMKGRAPTCAKTGLTEGMKCGVCGLILKEQEVIPCLPHTAANDSAVSATASQAGRTAGTHCSVCGKVLSGNVLVPAVRSFALSKKKYTYSGKKCHPSVTVKDAKGKTLSRGTDYTVSYASDQYPGKASVKVTLKGKYSGTRTLSYTISPKKPAVSKLGRARKAFTVKWKKQTKAAASGYQIRYSTKKSMAGAKKVTVKGYSKSSKKIRKLKKNKKYYVQVRTYKKVNGTSYYSGWSSKRAVKTK